MTTPKHLGARMADQVADLPPVCKASWEKNFFLADLPPHKMANGNFL